MTTEAKIKKMSSSLGFKEPIDLELFKQTSQFLGTDIYAEYLDKIDLNVKKELEQVKSDFIVNMLGQTEDYADVLLKEIKSILSPKKEVYKVLFYYLIIKEIKSSSQKLPNIHPGEVLLEEFLKPMGITAYKLSKDIGIPQTRISAIIKGKRRVTADTALRLSIYFGNSPKFWLGLQSDFDIEEYEREKIIDLLLIKRLIAKRAKN